MIVKDYMRNILIVFYIILSVFSSPNILNSINHCHEINQNCQKISFPIHFFEKYQLKPFTSKDAHVLFQTIDMNRKYLEEWLPWLDTCKEVKDSKAFILQSAHNFKLGKSITLGIWQSTKLLGVVSFQRFHSQTNSGELAYWIRQDYQGKGIITKACAELVKIGFLSLSLDKIQVKCHSQNIKSRKIPERLGFTLRDICEEEQVIYELSNDLKIES